MTNYLIREASVSDAGKIAELMLEHPLWQSYVLELEGHTARLKRMISTGESAVKVAVASDDTLLGFIVFDTRTFGSNGYIQLVGVRLGMTGHQIGDVLMETAHNEMRRTTTRCLLLCTSWNHGAQRFYRRHGYSQVGRLPDWVTPGTDELVLCNPSI